MVPSLTISSRMSGRAATALISAASRSTTGFLERPDRQSPNSVEVATLKARTAVFRERPSSQLEQRVKEQPGWLMFPNGLAMGGGVPLFHAGECVGAIAVSGIAHDDEPVAQAGAAVLGDGA